MRRFAMLRFDRLRIEADHRVHDLRVILARRLADDVLLEPRERTKWVDDATV